MKMRTLFAIFIILIFAGNAHAICLSNCESEGQMAGRSHGGASIGYMSDSVRYRDKSHDTRDVKNSVMGDVNIHVGHKRMDVKIDEGSSNNTVNASVSSTIILGDMKQ